MKIGRNDPCPCGSGKKYKKCCMQKDEEERRASNTGSRHFPSTPSDMMGKDAIEEISESHNDNLDPLWNEFKAEDYEGKMKLFAKAIDEPELLDEETAFEMLNILFGEAAKHGERSRFNLLVNEFSHRLPEVYADSAVYYLKWCIINALVDGRIDDIPDMTFELAEMAGEDIDIFDQVIDRLSYFGHLPVIVEAMHIAWPKIKGSDEVVPWGIDEFEGHAVSFELFYYLENCMHPDPADRVLMDRIGKYTAVDIEVLSSHIVHLIRRDSPQWTMENFSPSSLVYKNYTILPKENSNPLPDCSRKNLFNMSLEFVGYLRREKGVPYTKAELARSQIVNYILKRHAGELEHRESLLEIALGKRKSRTKPKPSRVDHLLCPDRSTLDRFLGQLLHFLNPQHYKVTATFEMIPFWLRFLESLQLIDAEQHERTLSTLTPLRKNLINWLETQCNDPAPAKAILRVWPDKA